MNQALLAHYGIDERALLGSGGESWVYALDDTRVLRVVKKGVKSKEHIEARKVFYDSLPALPFALPKIFAIEVHDQGLISIENLILGRPLSEVLSTLSSSDKCTVLKNYLAASHTLHTIKYPDKLYGEILTSRLITAPMWSEYLSAHIQKAVTEYNIKAEVPEVEIVAAKTLQLIKELQDPTKTLVHGDYGPANVLVGADLQVTGVIDFSGMSVVGDPFLDVAAAVLFLEVTPGHVQEDSDIALSLAEDMFGSGVRSRIDLYRLYYSFYFAFARDDAPLHKWCVKNLSGVSH